MECDSSQIEEAIPEGTKLTDNGLEVTDKADATVKNVLDIEKQLPAIIARDGEEPSPELKYMQETNAKRLKWNNYNAVADNWHQIKSEGQYFYSGYTLDLENGLYSSTFNKRLYALYHGIEAYMGDETKNGVNVSTGIVEKYVSKLTRRQSFYYCLQRYGPAFKDMQVLYHFFCCFVGFYGVNILAQAFGP